MALDRWYFSIRTRPALTQADAGAGAARRVARGPRARFRGLRTRARVRWAGRAAAAAAGAAGCVNQILHFRRCRPLVDSTTTSVARLLGAGWSRSRHPLEVWLCTLGASGRVALAVAPDEFEAFVALVWRPPRPLHDSALMWSGCTGGAQLVDAALLAPARPPRCRREAGAALVRFAAVVAADGVQHERAPLAAGGSGVGAGRRDGGASRRRRRQSRALARVALRNEGRWPADAMGATLCSTPRRERQRARRRRRDGRRRRAPAERRPEGRRSREVEMTSGSTWAACGERMRRAGCEAGGGAARGGAA